MWYTPSNPPVLKYSGPLCQVQAKSLSLLGLVLDVVLRSTVLGFRGMGLQDFGLVQDMFSAGFKVVTSDSSHTQLSLALLSSE